MFEPIFFETRISLTGGGALEEDLNAATKSVVPASTQCFMGLSCLVFNMTTGRTTDD